METHPSGQIEVRQPGRHRARWATNAELLLLGVAWVVSRTFVVRLFFGIERSDGASLHYIVRSLAREPLVGIGHTLVEYPVPAVGVLSLPWAVVHRLHLPHAYPTGLLVLCLLADAVFTLMLLRAPAPRRRAALGVWLLAVPLLGATAYGRLDIVPGVLAGTALLLLPTRPARAAGAAAVAAALKLWPVLMLPAMAAPRAARRPVLFGAGVLGAAFAAAGFVLDGWARLLSPLAYQAHRGLQIESVAATPAMVAWVFRPAAGFHVLFTRFHAFEIRGPWTAGLLRLSTLLTLLAVAGLVVLWRAALRRKASLDHDTAAWLSLTAVTAVIVTSKVLSPQYLLWLLPLGAAAVAVTSSRAVRDWVALLLAATALTQLEYPLGYRDLEHHTPDTALTLLVLVTRNVVLVVLLAWAAAEAVRGLRRTASGRPAPRAP